MCNRVYLEKSLLPFVIGQSIYLPIATNITNLLCILLEIAHNIHANHIYLFSVLKTHTFKC